MPETAQRLDGWKAIAAHLERDVRTVQRWEKSEGLPIHRHAHAKLGSAYAFAFELDGWRRARDRNVLDLDAQPVTDHPAAHPVLSAERRAITVVVFRLAGPDPSALEELRGAVGRYGGRVERETAGELLALFGLPQSHEDDVVRAVRTATSAVAALGRRNGEEVRSVSAGVSAGAIVTTGPTDAEPIGGEPVRIAFDLAARALDGEILVAAAAARQAESFFDLAPVDGVAAFRVVRDIGADTRFEAVEQRGMNRYVGRQRELTMLLDAFEAAASGEGELIAVVGEPGIGKSRLLHELKKQLRAGGTAVLQGRCQPYGRTRAYLPFIDVLSQMLRTEDVSSALVESVVADGIRRIDPGLEGHLSLYLHLLSIPTTRHVVPADLRGEDLRLAVVDALAAALTLHARREPTALLLEDWHWADEGSTEVLRQIVALTPACPLLVVLTSREAPPAHLEGGARLRLLTLRSLTPSGTAELAAAACGAELADERLASLVHERTGGNPFFVEELCHAMREDRLVDVADAVATLAAVEGTSRLPETVQAVIRMRVDRLHGAARGVLRVASVLGREFTRPVLERTLVHRAGLHDALEALKTTGLIQQRRVVPKAEYRFKHVVTQEVTYEGLLPEQRRVLHLAAARAIIEVSGGPLEEHADILMDHFSRGEAWAEAVRWGRVAARKAAGLSRFREAHTLLTRVLEWSSRLPASREQQAALVDDLLEYERLCEMLGARDGQQVTIDRILLLLADGKDRRRMADVLLRQGELLTLRREYDTAHAALSRALALARELGDAGRERRTLVSIGFCCWQAGRLDEALAANEAALALARAAGESERIVNALTNLGSVLRSMGHHDRALSCLKEARDVARSMLHPTRTLGYTLQIMANVYRNMNDNEAAVVHLQEALETEQRLATPLQQAFTMSSLANILIEQARVDEGLALLHRSLALSRSLDYPHGVLHSLRTLADVLVGLDRADEALPCIHEAINIAERLADRDNAAWLTAQLGRLLERDSRRQVEALASWRRAADLYRTRGDQPHELAARLAIARLVRTMGHGDDEIERRYEEALEIAERAGDRRAQADILNTLGILAWSRCRDDLAIVRYESARPLLADDAANLAVVLNSVAVCYLRTGNTERARALAHDAASVSRHVGQPTLEAYALATEGNAHLARGDAAAAADCYAASLQLRRQLRDFRGEAWMLERLARASDAVGDRERARQYASVAAEAAATCGDEAVIAACRTLPLYADAPARDTALTTSQGASDGRVSTRPDHRPLR